MPPSDPPTPLPPLSSSTGYKPLTITGTLSPDVTGTLAHAGPLNGKPCWTTGGVALAAIDHGAAAWWDGDKWMLQLYTNGTPSAGYFSSTAAVASPALVPSWTANAGATGTPEVTIQTPQTALAEAAPLSPQSPPKVVFAGAFPAGSLTASGSSDSRANVYFLPSTTFSGKTFYDAFATTSWIAWSPGGYSNKWVVGYGNPGAGTVSALHYSGDAVATPDLVTSWSNMGGTTGTFAVVSQTLAYPPAPVPSV
jgi:hypothetical protein